jgi:hypothetical protein
MAVGTLGSFRCTVCVQYYDILMYSSIFIGNCIRDILLRNVAVLTQSFFFEAYTNVRVSIFS